MCIRLWARGRADRARTLRARAGECRAEPATLAPRLDGRPTANRVSPVLPFCSGPHREGNNAPESSPHETLLVSPGDGMTRCNVLSSGRVPEAYTACAYDRTISSSARAPVFGTSTSIDDPFPMGTSSRARGAPCSTHVSLRRCPKRHDIRPSSRVRRRSAASEGSRYSVCAFKCWLLTAALWQRPRCGTSEHRPAAGAPFPERPARAQRIRSAVT
jgi:hypothetical protein